MWAEWYRFLAEFGIPPMASLPRDVWGFEVTSLGRVADLSDEDRLERVNLPLPTPGRASWTPFQAVGMQLLAEGWAGVLAPSSARPESLVLCVFLPDGDFPPEVALAGLQATLDEPPPPPTGMRT